MVAQRSFEQFDPDSIDDLDQPESLIRTGDAASLVPIASRDGSGVRLRRRARVAVPARPHRPGRHGGWSPSPRPQPESRLPQGLSRVAGFALALLVAGGFIFTVVRSGDDAPSNASLVPALPAASAIGDASGVDAPAAQEAAAAVATTTSSADGAQGNGIPAPPPTLASDPPADTTSIDARVASRGATLPPGPAGVAVVAAAVAAPLAPALVADADAADPLGGPLALESASDPLASLGAPFPGYDLPIALKEWPGTVRYIVQPGDLLGSIVLENRTTSNAIAGVNDLTDASHLRAGESLQIPVGYVDPVLLPAVDPVAALLGWPRPSDYTVRDGDSLRAVADLFFTTTAAIALLNTLDPSAALSPGETLRVPWGFTLDVSDVPVPTP